MMKTIKEYLNEEHISESIQAEDIVSEVEKAGKKIAKQYIKVTIEKLKKASMEISYNLSTTYLTNYAFLYQGLIKYSKSGRFADLSVGNWEGVSLRQSYLESIGKQTGGSGSFYTNIDTFDNLIKMNGPKKMKDRLLKHIESHIKSRLK